MNAVSDALTGPGGSEVFSGDSDPELVGDALPFAIKLYETLLAQNPKHQGLLLTTGSLFVMYANAFVQGPAETLGEDRVNERYEAFARAKRLYLRGADILYRGLELKYPGWREAAESADGPAPFAALLAKTGKADVPALYWSVAALLSAYSLDVFDFELGLRLPELAAMMTRAYELDPLFNSGAIDEFFVLFYASVPEGMGGDPARAETHFARAVEKSRGLLAGPYVSYAQAVCVPAQNYAAFRENLGKALAIDPGADEANRLANTLAQRKARWLLENASGLFLNAGE
ncbi:MAG: putative lipoprotein/TRAP transporter TatT component family protein [Treponematales bacterium]